jgi:glycosyltransferase involved in cell wall biosynthesis
VKVLFISSGKSGAVGEVVQNQAESLIKAGVNIDFFTIRPGLAGYLSAIPVIRRIFKGSDYSLAHAHYSLSAFSASLAGCSPLVVSLMGSDAFMPWIYRTSVRYFYNFRWDCTIVKTVQMKEHLRLTNAHIIPNGVDTDRFKPISRDEARRRIGYPAEKKMVLFISVLNRPEKNIELAREAVHLLENSNIELKHIYNVPNAEVPVFLNAADLLLLTSKWEGSVNVVKEAMACNCPVVSTDVGDVKWVIGSTEGCYITSFDPRDISDKIQKVIASGRRTDGREMIFELGLDSGSVAKKIMGIYERLNSKNRYGSASE